MQPDAQSPRAPGDKSEVLVEVPAPGLARGKYPAPAWLIGVLGASVLAIVIAYFAMRIRKARTK